MSSSSGRLSCAIHEALEPRVLFAVLLSENFEDGALDPRMSVDVVGQFNSAPGIKATTALGSQKAFGFGLSVAAANAFDNYKTELVLWFPQATRVDAISYKAMELFSNWGSKGYILVDGADLPSDADPLGKTPSNDVVPDAAPRPMRLAVNRMVREIRIGVTDITRASEVYIDDLQVIGPGNGPATIRGTVFHDVDGDGTLDAGERPLSGRNVWIDADNDGIRDASERSATTNSSGQYTFTNAPTGTQRVRVAAPSGWLATNSPRTLGVVPAQTLTANLGLARPVSAAGTVFSDGNRDGWQDPGEAGIARRTVFDDADNDGVLDSNEARVVSDASGRFSLTGLRAGVHHIRLVPVSGQVLTSPPTGRYDLTLLSNTALSGLLFGVG